VTAGGHKFRFERVEPRAGVDLIQETSNSPDCPLYPPPFHKRGAERFWDQITLALGSGFGGQFLPARPVVGSKTDSPKAALSSFRAYPEISHRLCVSLEWRAEKQRHATTGRGDLDHSRRRGATGISHESRNTGQDWREGLQPAAALNAALAANDRVKFLFSLLQFALAHAKTRSGRRRACVANA